MRLFSVNFSPSCSSTRRPARFSHSSRVPCSCRWSSSARAAALAGARSSDPKTPRHCAAPRTRPAVIPKRASAHGSGTRFIRIATHSSRSSAAGLILIFPRRRLQAPGGACGIFSLGEPALDEVQARVPEARVGEVHADDPAELLGRARAPGREQLEVARHELGPYLLVTLIDGQRQQLSVGVRVHVAWAADEMRDVGPPRAVALRDLDGVAEHLRLALRPELAEALYRELALLATLRVNEVLEAVHRDLAEDGGDHVLELLGQ